MRKKTIADKIAETSFYSNEMQKSWLVHVSAFGPILKPAFVDDYQAKVHVCTVLNLISNKKLQEALKKLEGLKRFIETDADKALYLFMMALIFEFAGMQDQMLSCYSECNSYKHDFYMPYVKVAKLAQNACIDAAVSNYEEAIRCLHQDELNLGTKPILGSVYTNYASALIMKHDLEKAKEMLEKSIEILPELNGREATLAIYYAASKNKDMAIDTLNTIDNQQLFIHTKQVVYDILENKHFQFNEFEIDDIKIKAFWNWFNDNEEELRKNIQNQNHEVVINEISKHLNDIFNFLEKEVEFGIAIDSDKYQLEFCDNYAVAVNKGLEILLSQSPTINHWTFKITR